MKPYTSNECYRALDVDPKTFREWLKHDEVKMHQSQADARVKYLTEDEIKAMAARHGRPWPPIPQAAEVIPPASYKLLLEQTAQAAQQGLEASAALKGLEGQIATIVQNVQEQNERISKASIDIEHVGQEAERRSEELHQQLQQDQALAAEQLAAIRVDLAAIAERQQEATTRLDTLTAASEQQQKQIVSLSERIDNQDQQHAQLSGLLEELEKNAQQAQKDMQVRIDVLEKQRDQAQKDMQVQIEQMQATTREQLQQALKGMKAEFQASLHVARKEMQAQQEQDKIDIYAAIQSAEQEEARDQKNLHDDLLRLKQEHSERIELLWQQSKRAIESANATSAAVKGLSDSPQPRLEALEQRLAHLEQVPKPKPPTTRRNKTTPQ